MFSTIAGLVEAILGFKLSSKAEDDPYKLEAFENP